MAKDKSKSASHLAAGQAAGYLFQPERALAILAKSDANALVGIEADDDIAEQLNGVTTKRGQLKHTITGKTPFADHSVDLWKTLLIWIDAAAANEFDPDLCDLLLMTNASVPECFIRRIENCKQGPRKIKACLQTLLADTFPATVSDYVARLRNHDQKLVIRVLGRIQIVDASNASSGPQMRSKAASDMTLPEEADHDVVINALLGWIHSTAMECWRAGQPAWIKKAAFANQLHRILAKLRRYKKIGVPAHLINVPAAERRRQINTMYVRQLRLIQAEDRDVLNAIDDFYRCNSERLRLAQTGDLTTDDWIDFEDRLKRHWEIIAARETRVTPQRRQEDVGYAVFAATIQYETTLADDTPQPYLTSGSFHRMANSLTIGWHPEYSSRCGKE